MVDLFYELIDEAKDINVKLNGDDWAIGFNTRIIEDGTELFNDLNLSTLVIKNKGEFFRLLQEYIDLELEVKRKSMKIYTGDTLREEKKILMSYLFVNATTEDFLNPCEHLRRRIKFLKDNSLEFIGESFFLEFPQFFGGCKLRVKRELQSVLMETPYKLTFSIVNGDDSYLLPEISYGISEEDGERICYIYSMLDKNKTKSDNSFSKRIKRKLYQMNNNVPDNGTEDSLTNVSPSSVLSLFVFLSLIKSEGIKCVRGVPYLPLRTLSRRVSALNCSDDVKEERLERNARIEYNVSIKFMRTFERVAFHMSDLHILSFPYQRDEFLHLSIDGKTKCLEDDKSLSL